MKKIKLFVLVGAISLSACATTAPSISEHRDEFQGAVIQELKGNVLSGSIFSAPAFYVNINRFTKDGALARWDLEVGYLGYSYLTVSPGETLFFLVDGKAISFTNAKPGAQSDISSLSSKLETVTYENVGVELIKKIAGAKTVLVKIVGTTRSHEDSFKPVNFKAFQDFLLKYPE